MVKETRDYKNFHTGHWKARDSYFDISVQWLIYNNGDSVMMGDKINFYYKSYKGEVTIVSLSGYQ